METVWRSMTVSLPQADLVALQEIARNDRRTPRDEAGILLSSILSRTGSNGSWLPLPALARLRAIERAAMYVAQLGNQPGMDDEEWEGAMTALEEALQP